MSTHIVAVQTHARALLDSDGMQAFDDGFDGGSSLRICQRSGWVQGIRVQLRREFVSHGTATDPDTGRALSHRSIWVVKVLRPKHPRQQVGGGHLDLAVWLIHLCFGSADSHGGNGGERTRGRAMGAVGWMKVLHAAVAIGFLFARCCVPGLCCATYVSFDLPHRVRPGAGRCDDPFLSFSFDAVLFLAFGPAAGSRSRLQCLSSGGFPRGNGMGAFPVHTLSIRLRGLLTEPSRGVHDVLSCSSTGAGRRGAIAGQKISA